ncbi:MAG: hypothetical protein QXS54_01585 [Candidatus Methanomethylicaceae archaeon]
MTGIDIPLNGNALCAIDDVKTVLRSKIESTQYDRLIGMLIDAFSSLAEKTCNRLFEIKQREEYFSASRLMPVRNYRTQAIPILSAPQPRLYFDVNRVFPASSELELGVDYVVNYDAGIVSLLSRIVFEAGWGELSVGGVFAMGGAKSEISFSPKQMTTKLVYTGGLVLPRPSPPSPPNVSIAGSGVISGQRQYRIAIVADGTESIVSNASLIPAANNSISISFPNPGVGKNVVIYRTEQNDTTKWRTVATVPGSSAPPVLSYTDNATDSSLTIGDPKAYGPIVVPADLRFACAQQCVEWFNKSEKPSVVDVRGGADLGALRFDRPSDFLPQVKRILSSYTVYRGV